MQKAKAVRSVSEIYGDFGELLKELAALPVDPNQMLLCESALPFELKRQIMQRVLSIRMQIPTGLIPLQHFDRDKEVTAHFRETLPSGVVARENPAHPLDTLPMQPRLEDGSGAATIVGPREKGIPFFGQKQK
jgi:hypothetical protein